VWRNADGSTDLYFGRQARAGKERNWIETIPGKDWFPILSLYSPLQRLFDKTWLPSEIETNSPGAKEPPSEPGAELNGRETCDTRTNQPRRYEVRGTGRATFAAILLLIAGTLNIVYGIGALDSANIFVNDNRYIFTNLNTMGWALIVLAVIQLTGGFSLLAGNTYGRVIGIIGGSLGAIGALLSIGGAYPWWSLAIFFLCVWIVYGILVLGEDERAGAT
jgi:hypothetical protein